LSEQVGARAATSYFTALAEKKPVTEIGYGKRPTAAQTLAVEWNKMSASERRAKLRAEPDKWAAEIDPGMAAKVRAGLARSAEFQAQIEPGEIAGYSDTAIAEWRSSPAGKEANTAQSLEMDHAAALAKVEYEGKVGTLYNQFIKDEEDRRGANLLNILGHRIWGGVYAAGFRLPAAVYDTPEDEYLVGKVYALFGAKSASHFMAGLPPRPGEGPAAPPPATQSDPQMTQQTGVLERIGETIGAVLGNTLAMQAAVAKSIHAE
jgi:hypothetical protein